jgi:hypothetical protein
LDPAVDEHLGEDEAGEGDGQKSAIKLGKQAPLSPGFHVPSYGCSLSKPERPLYFMEFVRYEA